ncbi:hypothetical protein AUK11_04160 [bacterium CG2_30_37_16]|nr:MAG: hypothetical protein AUK11_04160 [bacterium CG2_30_37_16]PIP30195.1 MAG: hypothetical protein COX25_05960 [bacterium (Candidatus Howlettbacteria) CG23_combo_of_CG06-09_8_20_14_all_37_9]PIX99141.1 MAG: hypothetical protein COZ22_03310 [bacterium (Candidatus Howlettbacteria) CG_4_10_14_3_um_filter_37_10]PJB07048.1 MAG: hypothetical protein CO123_00830 [bacterium (Candidatus Howlettbacteria) CG_4_9_14_3_um_filter_37_10]
MDKILEKLKKVNLKTAVIIFCSVLIIAPGAYFGWKYYKAHYGTAAVVGDTKISSAEYDNFNDKCKGFGKFLDDSDFQNKCNEMSLDTLILLKALETDAKKYNVNVANEEIDKTYKEKMTGFKSEEEFLTMLKSNYGWDANSVKMQIKIELLKKKLSPYLLSTKSVLGGYVRWDILMDNPTDEKVGENSKKAEAKLKQYIRPVMANDIKEKDLQVAVDNLQKTNDEWSKFYNAGIIHKGNLNDKTATESFAGSEDWAGISKLKKIGDISEDIKSSGGYWAVYKLTAKSEGKFNDWDDYLAGAKNDAKIYSLKYKSYITERAIKEKISSSLKFIKSSVISVVASLSSKPVYAGPPYDCKATTTLSGGRVGLVHYSQMMGWTKDYFTGMPIDNATVTARMVGSTTVCIVPEKTLDTSVTHNGGRLIIGNYQNPAVRSLSCWAFWDFSITHPSYETISWGHRSVMGNGTADLIDHMNPSGTFKGDSKVRYEDTNGITDDSDGNVTMIPKPSHSFSCNQSTSTSSSVPVVFSLPSGARGNINFKQTSAAIWTFYQAVAGTGSARQKTVMPLNPNTQYDFQLTSGGLTTLTATCSTTSAPTPFIPSSPSGSCGVSVTPNQGTVSLNTTIKVNYASLPLDAYDHFHCGSCQYCIDCHINIDHYYTYDYYRLFYTPTLQDGTAVGASTTIAMVDERNTGSHNIVIPEKFEYPFTVPLLPGQEYRLQFEYGIYRFTRDGDGTQEHDHTFSNCSSPLSTAPGVSVSKDTSRIIIEN